MPCGWPSHVRGSRHLSWWAVVQGGRAAGARHPDPHLSGSEQMKEQTCRTEAAGVGAGHELEGAVHKQATVPARLEGQDR